MFRLVVETELHPTEDSEKVALAIQNLIPDPKPQPVSVFKSTVARLEANSVTALLRFHSLLRRERILDAARKSLFTGLHGHRLEFNLNKQAAHSGRISFCSSEGESPLGALRFLIECDDPVLLVEWLAPKTKQGRPIRELPQPSFN